MRFKCGPTKREKREEIWPELYNQMLRNLGEVNANAEWERVFAILPVRVTKTECVCFEFVRRKPIFRIEADITPLGVHFAKPGYVIDHYEYTHDR